jgi:hypothetical protein
MVDLKKLPQSAVVKCRNLSGIDYYSVNYSLRIRFVTTLEYMLVCEGKTYGSVVAEFA